MKFHKLLVFMMVFSLAVFAKSAVAQDDDDMEEPVEMDEETWQAQMDEYTARKTDLQAQIDACNAEIGTLKDKLSATKERQTNAGMALWTLVGSKESYETYKTKFADAEKRVNNCKGPEDAMDIEKNVWPAITDGGNKGYFKCLDEFWSRYNAMAKKVAECKGKVSDAGNYTVVKGDCLSKIAGMSKIYGNSRLWPAIWDANKNGVVSAPPKVAKTIPNPNLIYPGQVLKIPALTDAQKKEMESKSSMYKGTKKKRVSKSTTTTDTKKTEVKKVDTTKKK